MRVLRPPFICSVLYLLVGLYQWNQVSTCISLLEFGQISHRGALWCVPQFAQELGSNENSVCFSQMPAVRMAANTSQVDRLCSTCPTNEVAPQERIGGSNIAEGHNVGSKNEGQGVKDSRKREHEQPHFPHEGSPVVVLVPADGRETPIHHWIHR